MNSLSISDPLPNGPNTFDATAFAAYTLSSPQNLAAVLDHTLLKPDATRNQVLQLCHEAAEHRFACAMVNPTWVAVAAAALKGTGVPVGVVIGFPLGATLSASKRDEATRVLKLGAHDVDMVLNVGLLKIRPVRRLRSCSAGHPRRRRTCPCGGSHRQGHPGNLPPQLRRETSRLRDRAFGRSRFLKTSDGFFDWRSHADDIALIRGVAGSRAGVKASGGIRSLADATTMLEAGASRIGASASVKNCRPNLQATPPINRRACDRLLTT